VLGEAGNATKRCLAKDDTTDNFCDDRWLLDVLE
jgi:hypothetical protein